MELFACFIVIVILIRLKIPIGVTLFAAAALLSFLEFGFTAKFIAPFRNTLLDLETWRLIATVALIITFGEILSREGFTQRMVEALKSYISPRSVAKIAPALIGLLPMPGGAMVSAPIVYELTKDTPLSPATKTVANYWWRHIWEPIWPLYQSVILAAAILNITVWQVSLITLPITISSIIVGLLLVSLPISNNRGQDRNLKRFIKEMIYCLWPVVAIVLTGIVFKLDLLYSILAVYVILLFLRITNLKMVYSCFKDEFTIDIVILFVGSLALMQVITTGQAAIKLISILHGLGVPVDLVVFFLPFLVGLLTGLTNAYIGVGFPIVLSLFPLCGGISSGVLLAFAGGLMGVLASPVHLCLVLTKNYFKADFRDIYKPLLPAISLAAALIFLAKYLFYPG